MSRVSSQKSVEMVGNRFDLVLIAAQRVRQLRRGSMPKVTTKCGPTLTALQEIEEGHVGRELLRNVGLSSGPRNRK